MKRSAAHHETGSVCKRRAPYAPRACVACRRRKGKCNGQQPCDFCIGRSQECIYDGIASDDWPTQHLSDRSTNPHHTDKAAARVILRHDSIAELVLKVKDQLDSLSRRVESQQAASFATAARLGGGDDSRPVQARESVSEDRHRRSFEQTSVVTTQCFYGPTSPDYSLNIAQMRVRQTGSSSDAVYNRQLKLASIHSEPTPVDITADEGKVRESPTPVLSCERANLMHLMGFRALINYREALRLLALYQDIVGDFHPFVNVDNLVARTRTWYIGSPGSSSLGLQDCDSDHIARLSLEEDLITYNLVLAIALHADAKFRNSDVEANIWKNCKAAINSRLISRTTGIQHVTIVLLKAWYDFANDLPRSAWRTCGIAGRMLMELGFHDYEVLTRLLSSEKQRTEACNLLCSITVLDRQWSASTGLPANFDANSFDTSLKSNIKNPYLKAMISFILISDKFHEPISRAARGGKYPDDDSFEVLDFQIEQWRKKAVGSYSFCNTNNWEADPTKRPPSWAIILHLRAECIRSLLLRPFFFPHADTTSSQRYLRPAIELLVRVTNILHHLDATTELYHKHHPCYQHVLASSTALSFLVAAAMEQNKTTMLTYLTPDLTRGYSHCFDMSMALASRYASISRLSRKLLERLVDMREILQKLGLLKNPTPQVEEQATPVSKFESSCSHVSKSSTDRNEDWYISQVAESCRLDFPLMGGSDNSYPNGIPPLGEPSLSQGWSDPFLAEWSFDDPYNMFLSS